MALWKKRNVAYAEASPLESGLLINWGVENFGFGQLVLSFDKDGKLELDTETMGPEFVGAIFQKLAEDYFERTNNE